MERNFKNILLLLLIGAAGTAYAWTDCGNTPISGGDSQTKAW